MLLKVLGSNSFGNCYILETNKEALIIEAGVRLSEVKKALRFNISKVVGAVISHEHNDHAEYVRDFMKSGILTLAPWSVFDSKKVGVTASFRKVIEPQKGYRIGGFKIIPIAVNHDVPCFGYIIDHEDMGRLLFVTDTMMLEYTIPNLNHILIEANYADDILEDNIQSGRVPASMRQRLQLSHMEIETTKDILRCNDLSEVSNIVLIHLSDGNSDEERFEREVRELTGKQVYSADKGLEVDISKTPY